MTFIHLLILTYIDPGSGSLLLQVIIASFLSIITFSSKVKVFVTANFKRIFKLAKRDIDGY